MTAAERLRRAAEVVRAAANAADDGPWTYDGQTIWNDWPETAVATTGLHENGALIALMDPTVGLWLADLLDVIADQPHDLRIAHVGLADAILAGVEA